MKSTWLLLMAIIQFEMVIINGDSNDAVQHSTNESGIGDAILRVYEIAIRRAARDEQDKIRRVLNLIFQPQLIIEASRQPYAKIEKCFQNFQTELVYIVRYGQGIGKTIDNFSHLKEAKIACMQKGATEVDITVENDSRESVPRVAENLYIAFQEAMKDKAFPSNFNFSMEEHLVAELLQEANKMNFSTIKGCFENTITEIAEIANNTEAALKKCRDEKCFQEVQAATTFHDLVFSKIRCMLFDPTRQIPNEARPNFRNSIGRAREVVLKYNETVNILTATDHKQKILDLFQKSNLNQLIDEAGKNLYYSSISDCLSNDVIKQLVISIDKEFNNCSSRKLKSSCIRHVTTGGGILLDRIRAEKTRCMTYKGL